MADANESIIRLETYAFTFSRKGHLKEALALLQSEGYQTYKKKYADGATKALAAIRARIDHTRRLNISASAILAALALACIAFTTVTWKRVIDGQLDTLSRLERTEANLFKALDLAEAVAWEADLRTGVFSSPSDMAVFGGDKTTGGFWERFLHADDIDRVRRLWTKQLDAGAALDLEARVKLASGETCWTRAVAQIERDESGRAVRAVGLLQNISKRKSYERDLQEQRIAAEAATLAKSQFLATMSHEIRTPLNGVLGMLDILLNSNLDPTQRRQATVARDSGNALLRVLNDILDYSKLEAGRVEIETTAFDVRDLTEGIVMLLSARGREKGLAVTCRVDLSVPDLLVGDPVRYRQILTNLLENAVKFTERGSIRVEVGYEPGKDGGTLRCAVCDTGIGISPEARARLFDRFTQADASTTRRFGGTGLGLTITKQLIELMDGTIGIESELNMGSTFWFTLPMGAAPLAAAPGDPQGGSGEEPVILQPLRILMAEDNAINQMVVRAFLKPTGHDLVVVNNGREALEAVKTGAFDVVLMDIQMPVMDGLAATRAIRELPGPAGQVPVVALTANAFSEDREVYLRAGMNDHLTKPIDFAALLRVISATGSTHAKLREQPAA